MAFIHSPKIVIDGMVLYLDPANGRSYPGSGTSWNNLVNNTTGSLINGPTFTTANRGTILFDGTNDYVDLPSTNLGNEITVMTFIRPQTTSTIQTILGNINAGATSNGIRLFFNTFQTNDRLIVIEVGNGSAGDNINSAASSARIVYDSWQHVTYVLNKNTSKLKIYYNGIFQVEKTSTVNNYNTNAALRIGTFIDALIGNYIFKGDMSSYMIYTRELSATEILQNFNATRSRFGV